MRKDKSPSQRGPGSGRSQNRKLSSYILKQAQEAESKTWNLTRLRTLKPTHSGMLPRACPHSLNVLCCSQTVTPTDQVAKYLVPMWDILIQTTTPSMISIPLQEKNPHPIHMLGTSPIYQISSEKSEFKKRKYLLGLPVSMNICDEACSLEKIQCGDQMIEQNSLPHGDWGKCINRKSQDLRVPLRMCSLVTFFCYCVLLLKINTSQLETKPPTHEPLEEPLKNNCSSRFHENFFGIIHWYSSSYFRLFCHIFHLIKLF